MSNSRISVNQVSTSDPYSNNKNKYSATNLNMIVKDTGISRLMNPQRETAETSKISKKLSNSPYAHRYLYVPGGLK